MIFFPAKKKVSIFYSCSFDELLERKNRENEKKWKNLLKNSFYFLIQVLQNLDQLPTALIALRNPNGDYQALMLGVGVGFDTKGAGKL